MADLLNQFVKFNVFGGTVLGKVILVHAEKFDFEGKSVEASKEVPQTIVELTSGQKTVIAQKDLTVLSEEDYNKELLALIDSLCSKAKVDSVATYKEQVEALKKDLEAAKSQANTLVAEKETLAKELAESKKSAEDLDKKNKMMCKDKKGCARFEELTQLEAVEGIAKDKAEAIDKLGDMSDEVYAQFKQMAATAFQKLTQVRQTSKPASTEVTVTKETKLTEASVKEPEVVIAEATKEKEADAGLETVATAHNGEALANFIGDLLSRNKSKVKTKNKENK